MYPADAFLRAVVAVHKGGVGRPRLGGLVFELLAPIASPNALLDLAVDGLLDKGFDVFELGCQSPYVLRESLVGREDK